MLKWVYNFIICVWSWLSCLLSVGLLEVLSLGLFLLLYLPSFFHLSPPKSTYSPWAILFTLLNLVIPSWWPVSHTHLRPHFFPEPKAQPSNWLMDVSIGMFFEAVHNLTLHLSLQTSSPLFLETLQFHQVSFPGRKSVFSSLPPLELPGPPPSLT